MKDDDDIQIRCSTSEFSVLCRKQAQMHICSVLTSSKRHSILCLYHANICLPIVEQIHTDYCSLKRLRIAYNSAYGIMHYVGSSEM